MNISKLKVCLGNTVSFSVKNASGTIISYAWDFGNSSTNNQSAPIYQYSSAGKYVPKLTLTFTGGTTCTVIGDTIQVVSLPKADFVFTTEKTQCFKGNLICIKDKSTSGTDNAPLKSSNLNWDDGTSETIVPIFDQGYCHSYLDPFGGIYTLVLEVTDTNGCVSRLDKKDSVTVFPPMGSVSFTSTYTIACPKTPVKFTNLTAIPRNQVKKFKWIFGDGSTDTVRWDTLTHIYTTNGAFNVKLIVTDINNCVDSFELPNGARNAVVDPLIYLTPDDHSCYRKNQFGFSSNNVGAQVNWALYDLSLNTRMDSTPTLNSPYTFPNCGQYSLRMYVSYLGSVCSSYSDTTINVYGPNAIAQNDTAKIIAQLQCQIHDTVRFRSPVPYLNCHSGNTTMNRLWDFGDTYTGSPYLAVACTTDTKNNINVGKNCRWSKDSMDVWHVYSPGTEGCFKVTLYMEDPIRGCWDKDSAVMKLQAPNAHWDSTLTTIRKGVYYLGTPCIGTGIRFMFDDVLPQCGFDSAWLMPDSACGGVWIPLKKDQNYIDYGYLKTCDSSGWVTYGAIVKNGDNNLGQTCYDTAWYHFKIRLLPIFPDFTLKVKSTASCGPYTIDIALKDSIQDSIVKAEWQFVTLKDGLLIKTDTALQIFSNLDSIIYGRTYVVPIQGQFSATLTLTNTRGCKRSYSQSVDLGYRKQFSAFPTAVCFGDTIALSDNVSYYNSSYPYWADTTRAKANLEKISWDIGDGNGYSLTGHNPVIKYTKPGVYSIKMLTQDSLGCLDSVVKTSYVEVYGIDANIGTIPALQYCAPFFVNLLDSTIITGSDAIDTWEWTFTDNKPRSLVKNPQHEFTSNGVFDIKLIVKTLNGCIDSASRSIFIKGPQPKFDIVTDTIGCSPLSVKFKNTTGSNLIGWQWSFHDLNNTIFSTDRDTDIVFTYPDPGIYKIRLFGIDTIRDPATNSLKLCSAYFPDTLTEIPTRTVVVLPRSEVKIIGPDSICPNEIDTFIARADVIYNKFSWNFGDNASITKNFPDTFISHAYSKTGMYKMVLIPQTTSPLACLDTAYKDIYVKNVVADFEIDETLSPKYQFTNKSVSASSYKWFLGADLVNKFSEETDPTKEISDTGSILVCLQAFNTEGCWDTTCREIKAKKRLVIPNVFTPGNNDGKNDAFDIDIVGWVKYDLVIYNRWGTVVFEGTKDGIGNDGINWNGKSYNDGQECSSGVYFFIFNYKMADEAEKTVHGTITLIRSEN